MGAVLMWAGVVGDPADASTEAADGGNNTSPTGWCRAVGNLMPVYKACRAACPMPVDQSSAAASATSVVVASAPVDERVVKLNLTVDPAREETVAVMT
eukprot:973688-Amphidinium_carterae.1